MKNRIKELREKMGISQEKLALGAEPPTTKAQISKLEKGDRKLTVQWAIRLSVPLECHWTELVGEEHDLLSPDEKLLILLYRSLTQDDQKRLQRLGEALADFSRSDEDGEEDGAFRPRQGVILMG